MNRSKLQILAEYYHEELEYLSIVLQESCERHNVDINIKDPTLRILLESFCGLTSKIRYLHEGDYPEFLRLLAGVTIPSLMTPAPPLVSFWPNWAWSAMKADERVIDECKYVLDGDKHTTFKPPSAMSWHPVIWNDIRPLEIKEFSFYDSHNIHGKTPSYYESQLNKTYLYVEFRMYQLLSKTPDKNKPEISLYFNPELTKHSGGVIHSKASDIIYLLTQKCEALYFCDLSSSENSTQYSLPLQKHAIKFKKPPVVEETWKNSYGADLQVKTFKNFCTYTSIYNGLEISGLNNYLHEKLAGRDYIDGYLLFELSISPQLISREFSGLYQNKNLNNDVSPNQVSFIGMELNGRQTFVGKDLASEIVLDSQNERILSVQNVKGRYTKEKDHVDLDFYSVATESRQKQLSKNGKEISGNKIVVKSCEKDLSDNGLKSVTVDYLYSKEITLDLKPRYEINNVSSKYINLQNCELRKVDGSESQGHDICSDIFHGSNLAAFFQPINLEFSDDRPSQNAKKLTRELITIIEMCNGDKWIMDAVNAIIEVKIEKVIKLRSVKSIDHYGVLAPVSGHIVKVTLDYDNALKYICKGLIFLFCHAIQDYFMAQRKPNEYLNVEFCSKEENSFSLHLD